ncbi:NAD-dependent epimerase/dehydratase family protein [Phyllobacterium sp. SYP-B3895]|uniref:NAD-dependent epimerase/dehydratase family protein n=1 Tax=Phyllobacterium sp. SYP-B3895 TaxID=2663240 RepID=UPI00129975FB|nr:NAD-dependent epimerase/dehydratase family protein [Phyllobacterium sp. SYP-B3895]MRG53978.1 NAD-dependent epimerase/dehydratase family protein [Phyllobacterium sp. SYP-B3895]
MIGIYGANGFIGRHLVERLALNCQAVKAVSRKFDPDFRDLFDRRVDFLEADIREPLDIAATLQDVDTVVQLVSTSSPGMKNDHALVDIRENVIPHVEFLQSCVQAGVKRYIFLSSGGTVYGPGSPVPTPESSPTNPINSHGLTKLMVEKYIQMNGHINGMQYVILRVANPFGPGQAFRKGQGLIPAILDNWQKKLPIRIIGDGRSLRDYFFIDDLISAIEAAIALSGHPNLVANVGSGEVRSVNDVIEAVEKIVGEKMVRNYVQARPTDVEVASLDITIAKKILNWMPTTNFHDGVRKTVDSLRI